MDSDLILNEKTKKTFVNHLNSFYCTEEIQRRPEYMLGRYKQFIQVTGPQISKIADESVKKAVQRVKGDFEKCRK